MEPTTPTADIETTPPPDPAADPHLETAFDDRYELGKDQS